MKHLQYTDFRNKSKNYLDLVEKGNSYIIIRKGKPIAQIIPFDENIQQGWKRKRKKITLIDGVNSLDYILEERNKSK